MSRVPRAGSWKFSSILRGILHLSITDLSYLFSVLYNSLKLGKEPFDSKANRKAIFNVGMIPNISENPRNRKRTKRGRKRLFNALIHTLRDRVERTFAWEDKFKRLLLRFEHQQRRHYGMKLMAYTLINLRGFCAT